jgi:hypothetical protein
MTNRQPYSRNLGVSIDELIGVSTTLRQDIENILSFYQDDWSKQTLRRTFIRASWAMIEGVVFCLKRLTLRACELGNVDLLPDEHFFLSELRFVVDPAGAAKKITRREDTLSNIKRSLEIAGLRFDLAWKPNFGNKGWRDLAHSLKLRHRLTHPKSTAGCEVSDDELTVHMAAFEWFIQCSNEFQQALMGKYCHPPRLERAAEERGS